MSILFVLAITACGDTPADTTPSGTEKAGEFVVTGEKYAYKNKDVLLLNAKNETDTNYTVTIHVTYLDADGTELKTQKQSFEAFSSGGQKYFFFNPNIAFDSYTYTVDKVPYDGVCYLHYINTDGLDRPPYLYQDVSENNEYIFASFRVSNSCPNALYTASTYLIVTGDGELYYLDSQEKQHRSWENSEGTVEKAIKIGRLNTLVIPEELTGDVIGFCVVRKVSPAPFN